MSSDEASKPPAMDEGSRLQVYALFKQARDAVQAGNPHAAERFCDEAWSLIREPKYGWDSSYMCLLYAVRFLRDARCYDKAIALVNGYLTSGHHHAYEHGPDFWLGTLYFEKGVHIEAYRHLDKANRMSRGRCFKDEDPRYKAFLLSFAASEHVH